ncbi:hypothetical protein SAMN05443665_104568 [Actinomadura meyerae]|uniref:Uncharacterized protein n=1 Tax=Actinomadura meyerae TaxID=240840 RepID=A0A239NP47_9ACTN|nr:hypothetical protein [Actinomadura meyerae]SNT56667.1 hypothetical protein SAMN05443665_104568 [Actinomadura meyerae]
MYLVDDGWISVEPPQGMDGLHVRVKLAENGRYKITDLFLHGGQIEADQFRGISISRLEAQINALSAIERPTLDADAPDDELTLPTLRRRAGKAQAGRQQLIEKLQRPTGQNPDGFYRRVAVAYADQAAVTRSPAKALADEAEVPVTTVHRWVREARRRGFLPPAEQGKAG